MKEIGRKLLALVMAICFMASMLPAVTPNAKAATSGTGTESDPLVVTDKDELAAAISNTAVSYIKLGGDIDVAAILSVSSNRVLTIDLAGHTIKQTKTSTGVFSVLSGSSLTINDSSGKNEGTITGGNNTGAGGGAFNVNKSNLTLNGGTITGNTAAKVGGAVYIQGGGKFIMNGGVISGNTANNGGGIGIYNGGADIVGVEEEEGENEVVINGGIIRENTANSYGGGVYIASNGTFSMTNAEISKNTANNGGGIFVVGGSATAKNSKVNENKAANGGGVYLEQNGSSFTMSGGEIKGNTASNIAGGVYIDEKDESATKTTFAINGGSITGNTGKSTSGGVYFKNGVFSVSGAVTITGNTLSDEAETVNNVYMLAERAITVAGDLTGSEIGVTVMGSPRSFTTGYSNAGEKTPDEIFPVDVADDYIVDIDVDDKGEARTVATIKHEHKIGDDENTTTFRKLAAKINGGVLAPGKYFLAEDFEITEPLVINNGTVDLCLNGHSITNTGSGRIFTVASGATLRICDCNGGNGSHSFTVQDSGLWVMSDTGTETVTGGVLTGGSADNGGAIDVSGTLKLYGGTIVGNSATANGGGISVSGGLFEVYGGTVTGNTAKNGGGIYQNGDMSLYARFNVTANTGDEAKANNLFFANGKKMNIAAAITGSTLGISMENRSVFTVGFASAGTAQPRTIFTADEKGYNFKVNGGEVELLDATNLEDCSVTLTPGNVTYSGSEYTQSITIIDALDDTKTLTEGVDYSVSGVTKATAAGTYTITLTGIESGDYLGSTSIEWTISNDDQPKPNGIGHSDETVKAKADGIITGLTDEMEYKAQSDASYTAATAASVENLAAGTYLVRYKAKTNYDAGDALEVVIAEGHSITVSFETDGGADVADATGLSYGDTVTRPAEDPTWEGYGFDGWFKDSEYTEEWDFTSDTVADNTTIYAKWVEGQFSVTGSVTVDGAPAANAKVELYKGERLLAYTTTDANGEYAFIYIDEGDYNLVVQPQSGETYSQLATINIDQEIDAAIDGSTSSVLELGEDMPDVMVGGLEDIAADDSADPGETVEIKMTINAIDESDVEPEERNAIKNEAGSMAFTYFDISLDRIVNGVESDITDTAPYVLQIIFAYDTEEHPDVSVFRYHDGEALELNALEERPTSAYADGTYFVGDGYVAVYAGKFSTYAIGYPVQIASIITYKIETAETENGTIAVSTKTASSGTVVTVTPTADEGYKVGPVIVTDAAGEDIEVSFGVDGTYTFVMPAKQVTVSVTFEEGSPFDDCSRGEDCVLSAFFDADPNAWYHDGMHFAVEKGYINGPGDGELLPFNELTRAEMVQILYNMAGRPESEIKSAFEDLGTNVYTDAIDWAAAEELIMGFSQTTFLPDTYVTREQVITILYRYAKYKGKKVDIVDEDTLDEFGDVEKVDGYALEAMKWAVSSGIIFGTEDGKLAPQEDVTRAEVAMMIMRYCTMG